MAKQTRILYRGEMKALASATLAQKAPFRGHSEAPLPQNASSLKAKEVRRKYGLAPMRGKGVIGSVTQFIKGGKKTFMELARYAPHIEPSLARVIEEWDRMTWVQKAKINLDQLCQIKGIDPGHFVGVVGEAAVKYCDNACVLIAAMSLPAVVKSSVERALTPDGVEDRRMLFQHAGFVPVSGGAEVRVLNETAAKAETSPRETATLPSFEDTIGMVEEVLASDE